MPQPPSGCCCCRYAVYVGNENAVTDDDFNLYLSHLGQPTQFLAYLPQSTAGPPPNCVSACEGHLVLPQSMKGLTLPTITGSYGYPGDPALDDPDETMAACNGQPVALQYHYTTGLDQNLRFIQQFLLLSAGNHGCNSIGRFRVYRATALNGAVALNPPAADDEIYDMLSGGGQAFHLANVCAVSSCCHDKPAPKQRVPRVLHAAFSNVVGVCAGLNGAVGAGQIFAIDELTTKWDIFVPFNSPTGPATATIEVTCNGTGWFFQVFITNSFGRSCTGPIVFLTCGRPFDTTISNYAFAAPNIADCCPGGLAFSIRLFE